MRQENSDKRHKKRWAGIFLLIGIATTFAVVVLAGQQRSGGSGTFTSAQATAGRAAYQANCAGCHQPDLGGQGDAAPLRGTAFLQACGARTTKELLSFMQLTMPPQRPGALSPQEYLDIVAFILEQNGAAPGPQAFTANAELSINAVATTPPDRSPTTRRSTWRCAGWTTRHHRRR